MHTLAVANSVRSPGQSLDALGTCTSFALGEQQYEQHVAGVFKVKTSGFRALFGQLCRPAAYDSASCFLLAKLDFELLF